MNSETDIPIIRTNISEPPIVVEQSIAVKLAKIGKILAEIGICAPVATVVITAMEETAITITAMILSIVGAITLSITGVVMGLVAFKKRDETEKSLWDYNSANYNAVAAIAAGTAVWRIIAPICLLAIIVIGITYFPKRMQPWQFNKIPQNKKDVIFKISCLNILYSIAVIGLPTLLIGIIGGIVNLIHGWSEKTSSGDFSVCTVLQKSTKFRPEKGSRSTIKYHSGYRKGISDPF